MASQPTLKPLPNGWLRFWFTPKDPSMLGLMRIITGSSLIYLLFAMCYDLTEFYGPNAWWSQSTINRERTEIGYVVQPLGWQETTANIRLPDAAHRRDAITAFLRSLPNAVSDRNSKLEFLFEMIPNEPDSMRMGMSFLDLMPKDEEDLLKRLDLIVTTKHDLDNPSTEIPPFITILPPEKREQVRKAVARMLEALPNDKMQRSYVVQYFVEMSPEDRVKAIKFIQGMPEDREERENLIRWVEYWNVDPSQLHDTGRPIWSTWFHLQSHESMVIVHALSFIPVILFTIGLWSRVTSVVAWLVLLNMLHRSQQLLYGMDTMLNILMVYLMIGQSGSALSLDRWLTVRRLNLEILRGQRQADDPETIALLKGPPKSMLAGFATRLIQIHFCFIYTASGMSKLKGNAWWDHAALWRTLVNPEFSPFPVFGYRFFVETVSMNRFTHAMFSSFGIAFTFALELGLVGLIWTRLRPYVVVAAAILHMSIAIFMGLTLFSLLMMTLLLAYIPPEVVRERVDEA